ncbi:hypothetical protein FVEN_g7600 [Fusarium venenatum]|uniref:uncharacterized protein n=1 Tax=Fusarium venenatum TaxID=56646 RepID=UPI001D8649A5|nr:hypothetical protein FVEN_g7600 [Fusarium venenatum]KAH6964999.1 hypothetical protein EDB82DRAFT_511365 [Fusarium venenatum]
MLSSNVIRAFALFAAVANAGPCRPSTTSPGTTIEATSTATVIDSTIELSSTVIEGATETETIDVPSTTTAVFQEPTSTTVFIEGSFTTEAASTATTAASGGASCDSADECAFSDSDLCLDGLLNLCVCLNAICVRAD